MKLCISEKVVEKLGEYGGRALGEAIGDEWIREMAFDSSTSVMEVNEKLSELAEALGLEEISLGIEDSRGRLRIICGSSCPSLLFMVRGLADRLLSRLFNVASDDERVARDEIVFFFGKLGGIPEHIRRKLEVLRKLWLVVERRSGSPRPFPGEELLNTSFSPDSSLSDYRKFLGIEV